MPTFDALVYYKLKSRLMELAAQSALAQGQIAHLHTQIGAFEAKKLALLAEHGMNPTAIRFDDDALEIIEVDAQGAPIVVAAPPVDPSLS